MTTSATQETTRTSVGGRVRRAARRAWTIRVRLTLLYGGLVLAGSALTLATTLLLLDHLIRNQVIILPQEYAASSPQEVDSTFKAEALKAAERVRADLRARTLQPLLIPSLGVLGAVGVGGFAIGWVVAGRSLRPIQTISDVAQSIGDGSLDRRVAMPGPRDELRTLADSVDGMLDRLQDTFDRQSAFVANASHELRTPVTITRTLAEVAAADPDATDQVATLAHNLISVAERQEAVIASLLTLARARADHSLVHGEPIDLAVVAARAVDRHAAEAHERLITVRLLSEGSAAPGTSLTLGDRLMVDHLTDNLLLNALRHNVPQGWVEVSVVSRPDHVSLRIENSGAELELESIPRLMEPFQRGEGRRTRERAGGADGHGLGLAIVEAVRVAHGAQLDLGPGREGGLRVDVVFRRHHDTSPSGRPDDS